ncbi:MAG: 4-hydroxythreonine-4-phosphate dehydrogenase PdxA [Bacteroidota bacterium]|nr:4-hydroxythreonine-4-phosphate dehydrogenase PdxA [Bacteroidota bacterium]MDX5429373.1 4-hydroxythreonine-4-phosphate dehydrogenase PdxA [Bacteroidota bacterium]MDX5448107.1 4-hydroxythreonine-4-phosphate dehydrogenase PdxA [Bacteroidota bacterium]MDX5506973.1 4-hydroxythreonine-4-phosphate dehydrogenase PdxA [Bacteroidota bacterium]
MSEENPLPIIGISCGDLNGIGMEVILKTLDDPVLMDLCTPVVFASSKVVSYHKKALGAYDVNFHIIDRSSDVYRGKPNLVNCWKDMVNLNFGQVDDEVGSYSLRSIDEALKAWKQKEIDVLVTAPINKNNIHIEGRTFTGHTGYLGEETGGEPLMILFSENMRVGLVTEHLPLSEVAGKISSERILSKLRAMNHSLKMDFSIRKPRIAVLGLNPHAGEDGLLGNEEKEIIQPAIEKAMEEGMMVYGPYAADGFFGQSTYEKFDAVLAMYHDQGLAPFKALNMSQGVNFTAGLPLVRTSPDHGTGYDIAGKGEADENSFRQAIYAAIDIWRRRMENLELTSNPLKQGKKTRPDG